MASVYSKQLFAQAHLLGEQVQPLPPGVIWVIRDIAVYNPGTVGTQQTFVYGQLGQVIFNTGALIATQAYVHWEGRVVIPEAGFITIVTTDSPVDITICGYELTAP